MKQARLVALRELRALFDAPVAYVATIASLLVVLSLFTTEFFLAARLDLAPLFRWIPAAAAVLLPALAMRLWAEERRRRTFELWVTLPLTASQIVLGKFLAGMGVWSLFLLGTTPAVALLYVLGDPDGGLILSNYLGALLLGCLRTQVEQHDNEDEEHHDRAGVDDDLEHRDERRAEQHEDHCR